VENIEGAGEMTTADAAHARSTLDDLLAPSEFDQVVVGTSHSSNTIAAFCAWPHARHVSRPGHDGADRALLDVLDENIPWRFAEVILASGDGIFTDSVAALAGAGVLVTVVARKQSLAKRLLTVSTAIIFLPEQAFERNVA
jgi:hypothetical protein